MWDIWMICVSLPAGRRKSTAALSDSNERPVPEIRDGPLAIQRGQHSQTWADAMPQSTSCLLAFADYLAAM